MIVPSAQRDRQIRLMTCAGANLLLTRLSTPLPSVLVSKLLKLPDLEVHALWKIREGLTVSRTRVVGVTGFHDGYATTRQQNCFDDNERTRTFGCGAHLTFMPRTFFCSRRDPGGA